MIIDCNCGCGAQIDEKGRRDRPRKFLRGHIFRTFTKKPWSAKPESKNHRTCRGRARKMTDLSECSVKHIGGCSHRIEVHHRDGNPENNSEQNRIALCTSHHRLVESGKVDLDNPRMPKFYIDGGGKRRYA